MGLCAVGARPVRDNTILKDNGRQVGHVSSGGFAPSLGRPAALGFVESEFASIGTKLAACTRGQSTTVIVSQLPFVQHRYCR